MIISLTSYINMKNELMNQSEIVNLTIYINIVSIIKVDYYFNKLHQIVH